MTEIRTEAGKRLLAEKGAYTYGPLPSEIAAIESEARAEERARLADAVRERDWTEFMLDALRASDGGNNPFYGDDDDTCALATELGEVIHSAVRALLEPTDDAILHPGPCLPLNAAGAERLARALCETFDLGHDHDHDAPRICPDGPEDANALIATLRADR